MAINQTLLESEIQTAVDNLTTSCSAEVFLETAIAADNVNTNRKFSAALGCQLPDLETANIPPGTMVYVEELGIPVVATATAWTGLDGRTYRKDVTLRNFWSTGFNLYGDLGANLGPTIHASSPVQEVTSSSWLCADKGSAVSGIKTNGTLWGWGRNFNGFVGNNTTTQYSSPVQEITSSTNWCLTNIGILNETVHAIKTDGTLWGAGGSAYGQVGDGQKITRSSLVQELTSSTDWVCVSNGYAAPVVIKTDGTLWSWGWNVAGQVGDNTTTCRSSPVQEATSSTTWCYPSGGYRSNSAIKTDGTLWSWGCNLCGQLGNFSTSNRCTPTQEFCNATNWCGVGSGGCHKVAIKTDGTIWSWGSWANGELGNGAASITDAATPKQELCSATNWCTADAGVLLSTAVKTDGTMWSWGCNFCNSIYTAGFNWVTSPVQECLSLTDWCISKAGSCGVMGIRLS